MATIAVFLAMGGSVYAAKKIGSKQIKRDAVLGKHVKDGEITASELGAGAVTGSELADGSATASKLSCPKRDPSYTFARLGELCVNPGNFIGYSSDFASATQQCAGQDLRLPTTGEAAILLRHVPGAGGQNQTWTSTLFGATTGFVVDEAVLGTLTYTNTAFADNRRYFCVTTLG